MAKGDPRKTAYDDPAFCLEEMTLIAKIVDSNLQTPHSTLYGNKQRKWFHREITDILRRYKEATT